MIGATDSDRLLELWGLGAVVVAGLVALVVVGVWLRRRFNSERVWRGKAWSFDDLSRMHKRGRLTEQEYHTLRAGLANWPAGDAKCTARSNAKRDLAP